MTEHFDGHEAWAAALRAHGRRVTKQRLAVLAAVEHHPHSPAESILAAVRENTWVDRLVQFVAMIGQAMPSFWLGLILMITLGLQLGWLPISGTGSWEHFVMPGIVLTSSTNTSPPRASAPARMTSCTASGIVMK